MPPKCKFTKDEIISAGLELTREEGISAVTARAIAARLHSSPKVIFGLFQNMEDLRNEILRSTEALYQQKTFAAMEQNQYPPYKAGGMAYVQFAREEKNLFKLLFMRDRAGETAPEAEEVTEKVIRIIQKNTGLTEEKARMVHLELWICVHGIASMTATSYLDLDTELVSRMLTDYYVGLKYRYCEEGASIGSNQNRKPDEKI